MTNTTEEYKKIDDFITLFNEFKNIRQQQKMRGLNDFNIFTTLRGGPSDEVRLHSRFLAFLLDPHENHYQGTLFLELFLQELELSNFFPDLEHCTVYAEYENIDIYITDGNKHIIVENKIWAGDQHAQIKRYIEKINDKNKDLINDKNKDLINDMVVVYLSVNRDEPSNYSLCEKEIKKDETNNEKTCPHGFYIENGQIIGRGKNKGRQYQFLNLHYDNQITEWLNKAHSQVRNITNLSVILEQYQEVLLQLYGKYKEKVMDLDEYLNTREDKASLIKTIKNISEEYTKLKIQMQKDFWVDLLKELDSEKFYFSNEWEKNKKSIEGACKAYYTNSRNNTQQGIVCKIENLKCMLIVYHRVYFCIKKIDNNKNVKEIDRNNININKEIEGSFYTRLEKKLNFRKFDNELIDMLSGEQRQKTIKSLAKEFKELVDKLESEQ
jgi:hypothetical protein